MSETEIFLDGLKLHRDELLRTSELSRHKADLLIPLIHKLERAIRKDRESGKSATPGPVSAAKLKELVSVLNEAHASADEEAVLKARDIAESLAARASASNAEGDENV